MQLHHVQVSMPRGGEPEARRFYATGLGMTEVPKPQALAERGGCWFRYADGHVTTAEIHVGVEEPFTPALKAHPALVVASVAALEELAERLESAGFAVDWTERRSFDGYERFHTRDAFGNRVEIMALAD